MLKSITTSSIICSLWCSHALGYTAYAEPAQVSTTGATGTATWAYSIQGGPNDGGSPGTVQCWMNSCWVGFLIRTGLGPAPNYPELCDSGGVCLINSANGHQVTAVRVPRGVTWDSAYETFAKRYGFSGTGMAESNAYNPNDYAYPYVAWGKLCTGFATLPDNARTVSILAPGSNCGVITPPNLRCNYTLPNALDFGVVPMGSVPEPVSASGSYSCNVNSTVSASIGTVPSIGGSPLRLYLNDVLLSQTSKDIAHRKSGALTLRGEIVKPMLKDGVYTESVPVIISFY